MLQPHYSNEKLFEIANESYQNMVLFCETLDLEGYWEEAASYLHRDVYEMLDMYLQAVLLNLNIYCGMNGTTQRRFVSELPNENILGCTIEGDLSDEALLAANKLLRTPPVLLQLCGLRDAEKGSFFSSFFLDSLVNILISCSLLDKKQSAFANKFITELYEKLACFVNDDQKKYVVDSRYIFLKVSTEKFFEMKAPVEELRRIRKQKEEEKQLAQEEAMRQKAEKEALEAKALEKAEEEIRKVEQKLQEEQEEQEANAKIEDGIEESSQGIEDKEEVESEEQVETEALEKQETVEASREKEDEKIAVESEQNQKNELDEQPPKKSVFDYTDEELLKLQRMGKLKIKAPKIKQLQEEGKKAALKKLEEQKVEDIRKEIDKINHAKRLQELLEELNSLIGLADVKKEIQSLINLIKVKKMRESYNMPSMDITYHMVFTGNPGTGKTTVARLVAQIYQELGILSKGHLVEVDRAGLVAGYVGQTAMKVKEVVERSLGGVLFIDEAYSLSNKNDANDFGGEAIDTLVKMMEDHRDDLVVIVAGYKDEMSEFLKANTGLISRFNKFVDFKDYTNDELMEILEQFAERSGVELADEAKEEVRSVLEAMSDERKKVFGNGRGMRNTFENIMVRQADRIVALELPTVEQLKSIQKEDVMGVI